VVCLASLGSLGFRRQYFATVARLVVVDDTIITFSLKFACLIVGGITLGGTRGFVGMAVIWRLGPTFPSFFSRSVAHSFTVFSPACGLVGGPSTFPFIMIGLTFSFSPPFVEGGGVVRERSVFLAQRTKLELRILRKVEGA
jgi:hypothetical protein